MCENLNDISLGSTDATARLAKKIAQQLTPGDTVLLQGDIGAGKTYFSRCLIQSLQDAPEDVPSPTFTLVQTYDTRIGEIWHVDLYRLSGPEDLMELGLMEAMETAVCLIEWPERMGPDVPRTALSIHFTVVPGSETRNARLSGAKALWAQRLESLERA